MAIRYEENPIGYRANGTSLIGSFAGATEQSLDRQILEWVREHGFIHVNRGQRGIVNESVKQFVPARVSD